MTLSSPTIRSRLVLFAAAALAAACGGLSEPPEVTEARKNVEDAFAGGPDLQILATSLLIDHPELPFARTRVEEALASSSIQLRLQALDIVQRWGAGAYADAIAPLLDDSNEIVRLEAAEALAEAGDGRGREVLETTVRDADGLLLPERCGLLVRIGSNACLDPAIEDLRAKTEPAIAAASATLAEIGGEEARSALRGALGRLREGRRAHAIEALGEVGDASDVKRVVPYIKYRANLLAVVRSLGALGGESATGTLREYAAKEDPVVQLEASGALLRATGDDAAAVARLAEAASSEREDLRYLAVRLLARSVEAPGAAAALMAFAGDDDARVRREAVGALAGHATSDAIPLLEQVYAAAGSDMEGAAYEAAQRALVAAARADGPAAREFLARVMRESDNWAHILQASYGLLHGRAATA